MIDEIDITYAKEDNAMSCQTIKCYGGLSIITYKMYDFTATLSTFEDFDGYKKPSELNSEDKKLISAASQQIGYLPMVEMVDDGDVAIEYE